jgi:hypothetical protein
MLEFFKRKPQRTIYFHEDDYCQIEILPLSNWDYCVNEIKKIDEFSEAHKAEIGWTDIYLRKEEPESLMNFSITVSDFKESVEKTLAPYSKVTTGYSSHVETCKHTLAWGLGDREFAIFANFTPQNLISVLWLDICVLKEANIAPVMETFRNLPKNNELMIADWNWSQVANIGDETNLRNYLVSHSDADDDF